MHDSEVTERDFRKDEFKDAKTKDYERREDGAIVRKDRWEKAVHSIRYLIGDERREFEVSEVVDAVRAIMANMDYQPGGDI